MNRINARFSSVEMLLMKEAFLANDGSKDGRCAVGGPSGKIGNDMFIDQWIKLGHNCTLKTYGNFGIFLDNSGVKGSLILNESDSSLLPTRMFESDDLDYTTPILDEFLQITCTYNYTENFTSLDLMDPFASIHWSFYASLFATLTMFIITWKGCETVAKSMSRNVRREVKKSRMSSWWIMTCAILDQDLFPRISRVAFSFVSLCVSTFFFIMIDSFMLNLICSDLVTIDKPQVVRTYQDILDRDDVQVLFFGGWDEEVFFKDAKEGTLEEKLWTKRYEMDEITTDTVAKVWQPIIDQKIVALSRDRLGKSAANLGLGKTREMGIEYIRAMETRDETGKFITNGLMFRKDAPTVLRDYY